MQGGCLVALPGGTVEVPHRIAHDPVRFAGHHAVGTPTGQPGQLQTPGQTARNHGGMHVHPGEIDLGT